MELVTVFERVFFCFFTFNLKNGFVFSCYAITLARELSSIKNFSTFTERIKKIKRLRLLRLITMGPIIYP